MRSSNIRFASKHRDLTENPIQQLRTDLVQSLVEFKACIFGWSGHEDFAFFQEHQARGLKTERPTHHGHANERLAVSLGRLVFFVCCTTESLPSRASVWSGYRALLESVSW